MSVLLLPSALNPDLQTVEQLIQQRFQHYSAMSRFAGSQLFQHGAARPLAGLVLLSAQAGEYDIERVKHAASSIELIAAATHIHEALVSEAARRRGDPGNGDWEHPIPLMVGNYLLALAAGEMALSPDARVIGYYSDAVMQLSEGVLATVSGLLPSDEAKAQHLDRLGSIYASLYRAACKGGASCGLLSEPEIALFGQFGYELGMAHAIANEIEDFAELRSDAELPGSSLRQGKMSLPLIFAAAHGDGERLKRVLEQPQGAELEWALEEVRRYGIAPARAELAVHLADALAKLAEMPQTPARSTLEQAIEAYSKA